VAYKFVLYLSVYLRQFQSRVSVPEKYTNLQYISKYYNKLLYCIIVHNFKTKRKTCKNPSKILRCAAEFQASPSSLVRTKRLMTTESRR